MIDLTTNYVGLKLRNPIIAAPAGTTGTVERMKKAEDKGVGAVVVKTLFEEEVTRISPTPRFKIIRHNLANYRNFSLYSYEQASEYGPEEYAEEIARAKRELEIPVIASISCSTEEGWVSYAKLVEEAGASALELNLSCPHGPIIMSDRDVIGEMVDTTKLVGQNTSLPLIPKQTPQSTNPLAVSKSLEAAGASAVVIFNRLTGLEIDTELEEPVMHKGYAGHGGPWAIQYPLRWISAISPVLSIPISGSGGVSSGNDVVKYLLAGATTVQICTAIIMRGYEVIEKFNCELTQWMERKGYETIDEFRGSVCNRILGLREVDRRHTRRASINADRCTSCGICARVCIYQAPRKDEQAYYISDKCDGCGLCVELCPQKAIEMIGIS
jgi:dihydroorotate dehydrogenase (fumarate)